MTQAENRNITNLSSRTVVAGLSNRRHFIGGSDARIIMGQDEKALIRLWQEKRGEVGPEDLSGELIVQLGLATEDLNRQWYERNTGRAITDVQSRVVHPVIRWMAATLDGVVRGREVHGPAAAQHVGHQLADGRPIDHHWGRKMGGDQYRRRSALPAPV